jgi:tRNA A-37 threonylcarbamoyl transferase component Bud32
MSDRIRIPPIESNTSLLPPMKIKIPSLSYSDSDSTTPPPPPIQIKIPKSNYSNSDSTTPPPPPPPPMQIKSSSSSYFRSNSTTSPPPPPPVSLLPSVLPLPQLPSVPPLPQLPGSSVFVEDSKISVIQKGLREFGLKKINITDHDSINNYFDEIIKNPKQLSDYINEFSFDNGKLIYKYKNSKNEDSQKIFELGDNISAGSYNQIGKCTDETGKEYVVRISINQSIKDQKTSFYENIKHCILYILIRNYIGNIKFIPQIYYIGIRKTSRGTFEIMCIMENAGPTLKDSITSFKYEDVQQICLMIYNSLFLIEDKLRINFKHNDLKCNNILISSEKKPIIIDFGFTVFKVEDIWFGSLYKGTHEFYLYPKNYGYNIVYDMIHLFTSLYLTNYPEPYKIFTFKKNKGTNILDSTVLIRYLEKKFIKWKYDDKTYILRDDSLHCPLHNLDAESKQYLQKRFKTFYSYGNYNLAKDKSMLPHKIGVNADGTSIYSDGISDVSIFITPTELADNIGIPLPGDDYYDKFEIKYRKYKAKYLKLKNQYGGTLKCQSCNYLVTSQEHRDRCTTSSMYEVNQIIISPDFKPMMTYGLGECTALLMVFFTKDTNTVYKVVLGHHPNKENVLQWFTKYYTQDYNIVTLIKTPEEWIKEGEKWITVKKNQKYWISNITKDNCKLIIESYSLHQDSHDKTKFNSSLYFKMEPGPKYSDNYGRYIDINYI